MSVAAAALVGAVPAPAAAQTTFDATDGSYAVAAPGVVGDRVEPGPMLAGRSVVWATASVDGLRLTAIRRADAAGVVSTLYTPPRRSRDSSLYGFAASASHVVLLRDGYWKRPGCRGSRCRHTEGELLAGPVEGPLKRVLVGTRGFRNRSGCRRGTAFMTDRVLLEPALSLSGHRVVYKERLRCPRQWRKSHYELVLHDLRTDRRRVVHRGDVTTAQLAGRYLAYEPTSPRSRVVVLDTRTGRVAYETPRASFGRTLAWPSLDSDGTLAGAYFPGLSENGRLGWFSRAEPRFHRLPHSVSMYSGAPLAIAGGRIAFLRGRGESSYEFMVTDLKGDADKYATFADPELTAFAFDGRRVAWTVTPYRAYRGHEDDGLPFLCHYQTELVMAQAPVVEVHPLGHPGRFPVDRLPLAPAPRDPARDPPYCFQAD